jgi:hypothetical protein
MQRCQTGSSRAAVNRRLLGLLGLRGDLAASGAEIGPPDKR